MNKRLTWCKGETIDDRKSVASMKFVVDVGVVDVRERDDQLAGLTKKYYIKDQKIDR